MRSICLLFQVHQPFRYRRYRFFEIGTNHYYYDDYTNESLLRKVASQSYLPTNKHLLELIKEYGTRFKVSFLISGTALDQFELYAPDVLESFQKLAKTGSVEFLAEPYSHTLASLNNKEIFTEQVKLHSEKIKQYFGKKPSVFCNSELIYNNEIGEWVAEMGYKAVVTEGAKHILGWKSPNYIYFNAINPRLKILMKNSSLSEDIAYQFSNKHWSEFPITADKFANWINQFDSKEQVVNLFMNYETFGHIHTKESGIFEFLKAMPSKVLKHSNLEFSTPSEIVDKTQPIAPLFIPHPISWSDEAKDISAWMGNELQNEAFNKLFLLHDKVKSNSDEKIQIDWKYLQTSDHLYHMCTKFFSHPKSMSLHNPYNTPYDAFINYMNILSDFELRLNEPTNGHAIEPEKIKKPKETKPKASAAKSVEKEKSEKVEKKAPVKKESKTKDDKKASTTKDKKVKK